VTENPPHQTAIIVSGALGRMGQAVLRLAAENPAFRIVGAVETADRIASCGGTVNASGSHLTLYPDLAEIAAPSGTVLIEFTSPEATVVHAMQAAKLGIRMVIGTTGLAPDDEQRIAEATKRTAILRAANMSVGVNMLLSVVRRMAESLPDYDIEIVETHHRRKKDAPSGTALALAQAAADGRGRNLEDTALYGREGMVGERPAGQIGIHAVRGGDVVGDHTVHFAGDGERIEVTHRATSRDTFAAGALTAAKWITRREPGLYSMKDVLGLD
jgi:4-hydroxy-tetrahydrodipicolinate reductase